jgi:DNA-binding NarL/FixJ family response regulator
MTPPRVLLAEDHVLMRAGLRLLIEQGGAAAVVAEANDGAEALRLAHAHRPDIAVLDIAMGEPNGLEVAARLQAELPEVRVIILSMHASDSYVQQALQAGVRGYLLKDAAPVELTLALAAVARGETYLSPAVASQVVRRLMRRPEEGRPSLEQLTPRQRDILRLIAEGHTTQAIANRLQISVKTAEGHRAQIMDRLGIRDVAGLVRFAIREGLVSS